MNPFQEPRRSSERGDSALGRRELPRDDERRTERSLPVSAGCAIAPQRQPARRAVSDLLSTLLPTALPRAAAILTPVLDLRAARPAGLETDFVAALSWDVATGHQKFLATHQSHV